MENGLLDIEQTENDLNVNNTSTTNSELKDSGLLGQITRNKKNHDSKTNKERDNIYHSHKGLLDVEIK